MSPATFLRHLLTTACLAASTLVHAAPTAPASPSDRVARGKYLAAVGDCMSCHTAAGGKPYAGGLYIDTPFGALASPNITPDKETGIGNWTDEQFYRAMHEGRGHDGRYLYPVMPFPWYTRVTREDVDAIRAYLGTVAPVHQPTLPSKLRFPYSVRESLLAWRTAFFQAKTFTPDPKQSDEVSRGAYLVNGLGHCGECHNARPVAGTSKFSEPLRGGAVDHWYAPNISSDVREGIGGWTDEQLVTYLKTGSAPGKGVVLGPMAEVVQSLSGLSDSDLHAIAAYLKSTPSVGGTERNAPVYEGPQARGAGVYLSECASCHGMKGEGVAGAVPALAGNGAVRAQGPQNVIQVVLGGLPARQGYGPMPAIGASLGDQDIADVTNYVRQLGGNAAPATAQAGSVAALRATTNTLYNAAPGAACPAVASPAVAQAVADPRTGLAKQLGAVTANNIYQQTQQIVATLHRAAPKLADSELINGLTAAYCPVVRGDSSLDAAARAERLGDFSVLLYSHLQPSAHRMATVGAMAAPRSR